MSLKRAPRPAYQPPLQRLAEELRYVAINIDRRNARERAARMADIIPPAHVERAASAKGDLAKHARIFMRALPDVDVSDAAARDAAVTTAVNLADALSSTFTLIREWRLGRKHRFDEYEFKRA